MPHSFELLKSSCLEFKHEAIQLKKLRDRQLIERDLLTRVNDSTLSFSIVDYEAMTLLEVVNPRAEFTYTWTFRIEYRNFSCRVFDFFLFNSRYYHVHMIEKVEDPLLLEEIERVNRELSETINYLGRHEKPEDYDYSYEYEDEKKSASCKDIEAVFALVEGSI